jgi:hypothetical protein
MPEQKKRLKSRDCPKCQCGLYEVFLDPDTNAVVAIECNMCGERCNVVDNTLSISQAGTLGELINGVNHSLKMKYYPRGSESADHPMEMVLRAFTDEDGSMYPFYADIREAYVWCSSIIEQFLRVDGLLEALDNLDGKHGEDQPIAIIEGV